MVADRVLRTPRPKPVPASVNRFRRIRYMVRINESRVCAMCEIHGAPQIAPEVFNVRPRDTGTGEVLVRLRHRGAKGMLVEAHACR